MISWKLSIEFQFKKANPRDIILPRATCTVTSRANHRRVDKGMQPSISRWHESIISLALTIYSTKAVFNSINIIFTIVKIKAMYWCRRVLFVCFLVANNNALAVTRCDCVPVVCELWVKRGGCMKIMVCESIESCVQHFVSIVNVGHDYERPWYKPDSGDPLSDLLPKIY